MLRLYLYARVRVFCAQLHTGPRVQRAPGLPCALYSPGGTTDDAELGRKMSREGKAVSICHGDRPDCTGSPARAGNAASCRAYTVYLAQPFVVKTVQCVPCKSVAKSRNNPVSEK